MVLRQLELKISGQVQGVGFRWAVCREASRLELVGRVRNAEDGSVEVIAQGPKAKLDQLITALEKGPGRVDHIAVRWSDDFRPYATFDITH